MQRDNDAWIILKYNHLIEKMISDDVESITTEFVILKNLNIAVKIMYLAFLNVILGNQGHYPHSS